MSVLRRRLMAATQKMYITLMYNVTDASVSTPLFHPSANLSGFPQTMTVDGTEVPLARSYRFGATGVHTVLLAADGITSIPNSAFYNCSSLACVDGLSNVTSIGSCAFYYCTSLTRVDSLSSVIGIGYRAFYNCTSLTSVDGLSNVTSIGNGAFQGCSSLACVDGLSNVISIGNSAFQGCSSLACVDGLSNVISIGNYAFYYCTSLTKLVLSVSAPPQLGDSAFNSTTTNIYVPDASLDTYRTATNWSNYASRIHPMSELNH